MEYNIADYSSEFFTNEITVVYTPQLIYSLNRPLQELTNFSVIIYERNIIEHIIIFI